MDCRKQYKVVVTPTAVRSLANIVKIIAFDSPQNARIIKNEIMADIRKLNDMPERHPYIDDDYIPKFKYRKFIVHSRYIIIYQVFCNMVLIEHVVDGYSDYKTLL